MKFGQGQRRKSRRTWGQTTKTAAKTKTLRKHTLNNAAQEARAVNSLLGRANIGIVEGDEHKDDDNNNNDNNDVHEGIDCEGEDNDDEENDEFDNSEDDDDIGRCLTMKERESLGMDLVSCEEV
jgi:cobalamin biosynthesis protein CobT